MVAVTYPPMPTSSVSVLADDVRMNVAVIVSGVAVDVVTDTEDAVLLSAATLLVHVENTYPKSAIAASVMIVPVGTVIVYGIAEASYVNSSPSMVAVTYPPVPTLSVSVLADAVGMNVAVMLTSAVTANAAIVLSVLFFPEPIHLENVSPSSTAVNETTAESSTVIGDT